MLIAQVLGQAPMLIVYLFAIVVALVLRSKSPFASSLVLAAAALSVALSVTWLVFFQWAVSSGNTARLQQVAPINQVLHAVAYCLLLAAAFVDRNRERASGFEVRTAAYAPPAPPPPARRYGE